MRVTEIYDEKQKASVILESLAEQAWNEAQDFYAMQLFFQYPEEIARCHADWHFKRVAHAINRGLINCSKKEIAR